MNILCIFGFHKLKDLKVKQHTYTCCMREGCNHVNVDTPWGNFVLEQRSKELEEVVKLNKN